MAGVFRYKRESQENMHNHGNCGVKTPPPTDSPVLCEFCGGRARPPLHPGYTNTCEEFCCGEYQELFKIITREESLVLDKLSRQLEPSTQTCSVTLTAEEEQSANAKARELEAHKWQQKETDTKGSDASLFSASIYPTRSNTIRFQLSKTAPTERDCGDRECSGLTDPCNKKDEVLVGPSTFGFGFCNHKEAVSLIEKYYSDGKKFLTIFPDGSGQVLYPSGHLAVVIVISGKERICIVQDDQAVEPPIRAAFQSSGGATCYHKDGSIWLGLNVWGGQCLDEDGSRIRRWFWSDHLQTPTPLKPVFLSLNNNVGVRVLGRQEVFVSFLAFGQQAKFSVGTSLQGTNSAQPKGQKTPLSADLMSNEELVLLSASVGARRALLRLQNCCSSQSGSKGRGCKPFPLYPGMKAPVP
ncbi:glutamate-rich protein 6 [Denticeps clupeoides]|uniref:glutamate-rich protein 6 n=1 Tax=Denticeps clupeoides TaxID=299321 RepID=UPI0010A41B36|nr:glutamate-rich protein 6 [Denticeps clupeoides]